MKTFEDGTAYQTIQIDIENNFHKYINKSRDEIGNICIVGAHYGQEIYTLLKNYPNANIMAFEAHPKHFSVLQNRFSSNGRVELFNKAVTNEVGVVDFYELTSGGSGSILKFQGDQFGHHFKISEVISVESTTLNDEIGDKVIDMLWVDVQGAELIVLEGVDTNRCLSLFLEIHTRDYVQLWDKEPYIGQCYKEDLESFLINHKIHSIGLDNINNNGQGNSFWVKRK